MIRTVKFHGLEYFFERIQKSLGDEHYSYSFDKTNDVIILITKDDKRFEKWLTILNDHNIKYELDKFG